MALDECFAAVGLHDLLGRQQTQAGAFHFGVGVEPAEGHEELPGLPPREGP